MRTLARLLAALALAAGLLTAGMFFEATSAPVVRRATLPLAGLPHDAAVKVVLISDIHIGTAAMGPRRLERIVAQINALQPDLVLIAGDFIFGHDPAGAARLGPAMVAPLSKLRARYGTVAVLGNHDHWTGAAAVRDQLARARITLLDNQAARAGPLTIGGVGDDFTDRADIPATMAAVRAIGGPVLLVTHSPDIAPALPPDAPLLLAGHTHCGQAVLFGHQLAPLVSRYGERYRCGIVRDGRRTVVVTGGLGTSGVPLRIGAPPDLWLLRLTGPAR